MDPKERLSAVDCLRRVETDVLNNHILDKGVITRTRKTALRDEVVDANGAKPLDQGSFESKRLRFLEAMSALGVSQKYQSRKWLCKIRFLVALYPLPPSRGLFETNRPQIREMLAILVVSLKRNCRKRICRIRLLIAMAPLLS